MIVSRGASLELSDVSLLPSNSYDSAISVAHKSNLSAQRLHIESAANVGITKLGPQGAAELGRDQGLLELEEVSIHTVDLSPNLELHPISLLFLEGALESSEGRLSGSSLYTNAPIIINSTGINRARGVELFEDLRQLLTCQDGAYLLDCALPESVAYEQICRDF
jgi:hypothetical protein